MPKTSIDKEEIMEIVAKNLFDRNFRAPLDRKAIKVSHKIIPTIIEQLYKKS